MQRATGIHQSKPPTHRAPNHQLRNTVPVQLHTNGEKRYLWVPSRRFFGGSPSLTAHLLISRTKKHAPNHSLPLREADFTRGRGCSPRLDSEPSRRGRGAAGDLRAQLSHLRGFSGVFRWLVHVVSLATSSLPWKLRKWRLQWEPPVNDQHVIGALF